MHHSDNLKHFDKNFGSMFSIWDWMFGTLYRPEKDENIVFGIGHDKETERYDTVMKLLFWPLIAIYDLQKKKFGKSKKKLPVILNDESELIK